MIVFNLGAKEGCSSTIQLAAAQSVLSPLLRQGPLALCVARGNLMSFAPVVIKAWIFGSLLAAASPAHAVVEAVIRPSVAATQRAWLYCVLGAAEDLRAGIERFQTAAHTADRALVVCQKGEDLYSDAILNNQRRMLDIDAASRMRTKIRDAVIQYLEMER